MLVDDVVVVVPGIMGSALVDRDGREVWGAGGVVHGLQTLGRSVRSLRLPDQLGNDPAPDGVRATRLLNSFHALPGVWTPVVGYDRLLEFLRGPRVGLRDAVLGEPDAPPGNLVIAPYDWRLSNRRSAAELMARVEPALDRWRRSDRSRAEAQLVFVCHSMGGLVARWYLQKLGGAAHTRALITLGTPYRGSLNALDQLVNGVRKGVGPLRVDLTALARSFPAIYQLLPEYACVETPTGLAKTTGVRLPHLDPVVVADAMAFHDELDQSAHQLGSCSLVPIVGTRQKTWTTCSIRSELAELHRTIDGKDLLGDGTVPRLAARPKGMNERDPVLRGIGEGHGSLVSNDAVFDQLELLLTGEDVVYRDLGGRAVAPSVEVEPLYEAGEAVPVVVELPEAEVLEVGVRDAAGREVGVEPVVFRGSRDGPATGIAEILGLGPGGYVVEIGSPLDLAGDRIARVHRTTVVMEAGAA